jgi:hypothetical protein
MQTERSATSGASKLTFAQELMWRNRRTHWGDTQFGRIVGDAIWISAILLVMVLAFRILITVAS